MTNTHPRKVTFLAFFCFLYLFSLSSFAQVGINTTEPRTMLEVAGDASIQGGDLKVAEIRSIQDGDQGHLLAQTQDNLIKDLDIINQDGVALAYFQEYVLTNMDGDWVANFNTKVDATKYGMIVISAFFNLDAIMVKYPKTFTIPSASAFIEGGTWRILADYPSAEKSGSGAGVWTITTLILTKSVYKELTKQTVKMAGKTSGAAATPIIN